MAGEGDPQIRRPALHHLPLRADLFPETRHHARFRGKPARRRHRGPADDAPDARGVPPPQLPRPTPDRRPAGRQPPERDPRQPAANGRAVAKIPRAPVRGGGRRMARPGALRTIHSRKRHPLRLRPDLRDACGGRGGRGDVGHGDARNGPAGHSRSGGLPHGVVAGLAAALRAEGPLGVAREPEPGARGRRRDHPVGFLGRPRRTRAAGDPARRQQARKDARRLR